MKKSIALAFPLILIAMALSNCRSDAEVSDSPPTVEDFSSLVSDGVDFDYDPLDSPEEAVELADLIVLGTVTGVTEGRWWTSDQLRGGRIRPSIRYAILEVEVDRVLSGSVRSTADHLNVAVTVSHGPEWDDIERSLPRSQVLLILGDRSKWRAGADVEGIPDYVYEPSPDGIWFATDAGFQGITVDKAELEAQWGTQFQTLDALAAALEAAANE